MVPSLMSATRLDLASAGMPDARPFLSPEQRRIAAERFERARQVITTGNIDYGLQLLLTCCKIDPSNFVFR